MRDVDVAVHVFCALLIRNGRTPVIDKYEGLAREAFDLAETLMKVADERVNRSPLPDRQPNEN